MEGEVIQIKQDRLNQMPNKVTAQPKALLRKQSTWEETRGRTSEVARLTEHNRPATRLSCVSKARRAPFNRQEEEEEELRTARGTETRTEAVAPVQKKR